jgi:twitching motility protein PilT
MYSLQAGRSTGITCTFQCPDSVATISIHSLGAVTGLDLQVAWFRYILIDRKVLTPAVWDTIEQRAPAGADLLEYGQELIDADICTDLNELQDLVYAADAKASEGSPPPVTAKPPPPSKPSPKADRPPPSAAGSDPPSQRDIEAAQLAEAIAAAAGGGGDTQPAENDAPAAGAAPAPAREEVEHAAAESLASQATKIAQIAAAAQSFAEAAARAESTIVMTGTPTPRKGPEGVEKATVMPRPEQKPGTTAASPRRAPTVASPPIQASPQPAEPPVELNSCMPSMEPAAPAPAAQAPIGPPPAGQPPAAAPPADGQTVIAPASNYTSPPAAPEPQPYAPPAGQPSTASAPPPEGPVTAPERPAFEFRPVDFTHDHVNRMQELLRQCRSVGASDLHVSAGAPIFMRCNKEIQKLTQVPIEANEAERLVACLLSDSELGELQQTGDCDLALALDGIGRFRVNLMHHKQGCAATYRLIPDHIQSLEELGFVNHAPIHKLLEHHNGLILVTGPIGSGKTTTLATLIELINQQREDHIITVENPIEFVQADAKCNVTQRQVGLHTNTFHSALKGALREDPDIIVIGELRDLETIEMAIAAAETGHLVIGTLHTSDAATTLSRLQDVFPLSAQPQIRAMTSESLRGIICQKLLPGAGGGVVLAVEVLINTLAVAGLIRDNKTHQLYSVMQTGLALGMCTMDSSIYDLFRQGKITEEVARRELGNADFEEKQRTSDNASNGEARKKGWLR